jgi:hypothetical protein
LYLVTAIIKPHKLDDVNSLNQIVWLTRYLGLKERLAGPVLRAEHCCHNAGWETGPLARAAVRRMVSAT